MRKLCNRDVSRRHPEEIVYGADEGLSLYNNYVSESPRQWFFDQHERDIRHRRFAKLVREFYGKEKQKNFNIFFTEIEHRGAQRGRLSKINIIGVYRTP